MICVHCAPIVLKINHIFINTIKDVRCEHSNIFPGYTLTCINWLLLKGIIIQTKQIFLLHLIIFIDERYIRVPNIDTLVSELKAFEYKFVNEKTGELLRNTKYGAPIGYHDDAVISFGLAIWGLNLQLPSTIDPIAQELKKYKKPNIKTFI